MKNKEELELIAREIIKAASKETYKRQMKYNEEYGVFMAPLVDSTEMVINGIIEALQRIQDEALNSVSEELSVLRRTNLIAPMKKSTGSAAVLKGTNEK